MDENYPGSSYTYNYSAGLEHKNLNSRAISYSLNRIVSRSIYFTNEKHLKQ